MIILILIVLLVVKGLSERLFFTIIYDNKDLHERQLSSNSKATQSAN